MKGLTERQTDRQTIRVETPLNSQFFPHRKKFFFQMSFDWDDVTVQFVFFGLPRLRLIGAIHQRVLCSNSQHPCKLTQSGANLAPAQN